MPAQKAARVQERRRAANRAMKSGSRTAVKKARRLIQSGSEQAAAAVDKAVSMLDRAVSKGVVHRNNAARRKSRLIRSLRGAEPQE